VGDRTGADYTELRQGVELVLPTPFKLGNASSGLVAGQPVLLLAPVNLVVEFGETVFEVATLDGEGFFQVAGTHLCLREA
jgi:hypothetical protein